MDAQNYPVQFPCWVKALYSWGGEAKGDLGFMEGDYIECLNGGNGSWWTGRLKRDRRMIGLFPSNFVKIIDQDWQPTTRQQSPMTATYNSPTSAITPPSSAPITPIPQKGKSLFRKPFSAMTNGQSPPPQSIQPSPKTTKKYAPFSSMKDPHHSSPMAKATPPRIPSPTIPAPLPRSASPLPPMEFGRTSRSLTPNHSTPPPAPFHSSVTPLSHPQQYDERQLTSYREPQRQYSDEQDNFHYEQQHYQNDGPEQQENQHYQDDYHPYIQDSVVSVPPPPPPTHRVAYSPWQNEELEDEHNPEPDAANEQHYIHSSLPQTPQKRAQQAYTPSPGASNNPGHTPSPLRDAMNDVMTSLEGMGMEQRSDTPPQDEHEISSVWSPDDYSQIYPRSTTQSRPNTSMGLQHPNTQLTNGQAVHHLPSQPIEDNSRETSEYVQRMESRMGQIKRAGSVRSLHNRKIEDFRPMPPPKNQTLSARPATAYSLSRPASNYNPESRPGSASTQSGMNRDASKRSLKHRKSAYELGKDRISRTFTTKSSVTEASAGAQSSSTNTSHSTAATSQSVMSGFSAGGFSATSAGSLARRKFGSVRNRPKSMIEEKTGESLSSMSYHSSHASKSLSNGQENVSNENSGLLGGFTTPSAPALSEKKSGFFSKVRSLAKTSTANSRAGQSPHQTLRKKTSRGVLHGIASVSGSPSKSSSKHEAANDMGLGGGVDWVQMRRDVNRSNSLSRNERAERRERCQMMDILVMNPVDVFNNTVQGDESGDGYPITQPTDFQSVNYAHVDKSARFVSNLPAVINSISLAQSYVCRPHRTDVQRLRSIFTWVAERISWEEDYEGEIDTRHVIQSKRGCSHEIAVLVSEMCMAMDLYSEVIRGYLKLPGEVLLTEDLNELAARPNHWWNAVLLDGEWRIIDCALANPTNPHRNAYTSAGNQAAETWWFLTRPMEICYTHIPLLPEHQHVVPPLPHDVLMALPVACPTFFRNKLQMWDFDTSLLHLDSLDVAHVQIVVPDEVECFAEIEARTCAQDVDGDLFESGDVVRKRAMAQAEFVIRPEAPLASPFKRYTIKAVIPTHGNIAPHAVLKVYTGRRGLMHSVNNNPHALALALDVFHDDGPNPEFDFFTRHPTPHALRHEIYVTGPMCKSLAMNNTFVFGVRQHPSNPNPPQLAGEFIRPGSPERQGAISMLGISRPGSALSTNSISASGSGSGYSNPTSDNSGSSNGIAGSRDGSAAKPAKLAIQSPSGKILRMTRKVEHVRRGGEEEEARRAGSAWEAIIKIGEKGTWRGLVLADRSARWCVFGEWEAH